MNKIYNKNAGNWLKLRIIDVDYDINYQNSNYW